MNGRANIMIIVFWKQGEETVERRVDNERQAATLMIIKKRQGYEPQARAA
jgi:hypothetical protein